MFHAYLGTFFRRIECCGPLSWTTSFPKIMLAGNDMVFRVILIFAKSAALAAVIRKSKNLLAFVNVATMVIVAWGCRAAPAMID